MVRKRGVDLCEWSDKARFLVPDIYEPRYDLVQADYIDACANSRLVVDKNRGTQVRTPDAGQVYTDTSQMMTVHDVEEMTVWVSSLRIDRESKSSDLSSGPSPFIPILFLFLLLSPKLRLAYYSRHLKRGNPIKATEYDEQLEQALEEGMEFSGSLQHRLVPTVSTLRIAA